MSRDTTILVVDDQQSARTFLQGYLEGRGHRCVAAASAREALEVIDRGVIDLVITDLCMPEMDGLALLESIRERGPDLPVILVTAYATIETAVKAMKVGAYDYLKKPIEPEELTILVDRALAHQALVRENRLLRAEVEKKNRLDNLIGQSRPMQELFELVRRVAPVDYPVLVTGESGTGKELVARALHGLSARKKNTFLSVNCAAITETLLESELFGHEKGAFTGAMRARPGHFREASGGTLFLDEIGEMPLAQQAKLLRVLETGEVMPVGGDRTEKVDIRLVAATNRDPEEMVAEGGFRHDLLYRIDTVRVHLPPLRERPEDIPLLVDHFLKATTEKTGKSHTVSSATLQRLIAYPWPGNVRELAHAIEHGVLVASGERLEPGDLPARIAGKSGGGGGEGLLPNAGSSTFRAARLAFERAYLEDLLERAGGNISRAAAMAGLHRSTLHEKLRRHDLGGS
ncbi:MAG: sigma-54 dependent transcriptional regulator [Deltaproteobacteria bacterium]|nr:sigma-54 dependent transcriptional regulator [Deltaproteobacteria bacterium]